MTRVRYFIAVVCGLAVAPVGVAAADSGPRAKPVAAITSVVSVLPITDRGNTNMEEPEGTAFATGDGSLYVTADHVLGRATQVRIRLTVPGIANPKRKETFGTRAVLPMTWAFNHSN